MPHKSIMYAGLGLILYTVVRGFFVKLAAKLKLPFVGTPTA